MRNYLLIISILIAMVISGCSRGEEKQGNNSSSTAAESNKLDQQRFDKATFE